MCTRNNEINVQDKRLNFKGSVNVKEAPSWSCRGYTVNHTTSMCLPGSVSGSSDLQLGRTTAVRTLSVFSSALPSNWFFYNSFAGHFTDVKYKLFLFILFRTTWTVSYPIRIKVVNIQLRIESQSPNAVRGCVHVWRITTTERRDV